MTISTSRLSYGDCYKVLERALEDKLGVRVEMDSQDAAVHFRMRLHMARKINRQDNAEVYALGNPMHGSSAYDRLTVRIKTEEEKVYIYVEQSTIKLGDIEPLANEPPDEEALLPAPEPRRQIEHRPEPLKVEDKAIELEPSQFRRV